MPDPVYYHHQPKPTSLTTNDSVVVIVPDTQGIPVTRTMALKDAAYYLAQQMQNGTFAATGDALTRGFTLRKITSNATPASLLTDGSTSTAKIILPNSTSMTFSALITARDSAGNHGSYKIEGAIKRGANAAATALVGSVTVTTLAEDTAAWDVTAVADTTNGALDIQVTGAAATTIRWLARVNTVEVTY